MKWFRPFRKEPQTAAAPMPPPRTPDPAPIQIDEVTPHMVQSALDAGEALLFVDVRQRWDYEMQRPARAISLPLNELPERYDELDRSQRIVLTCYHGYTSLQGAAFLMQQGFVNFMMIQRAMIHPDGFAAEPAFQMTHNGTDPVTNPGTPAIDVSAGEDTRGYYMGISQGGIMGGALTALSPDVDRGVLGVPGINYSLLLRRSVDSDEYFQAPGYGLYANYPDLSSRPLLLSLMQLLWDRGEGNGYAHNMTDNPLENTNPHEVLLQLALGDHQVTNFAAEVEARTIGAQRYAPTLRPERTWDLDYEALPPTTSFPAGPDESFMVYYDGGPTGFNGTLDPGTAVPPLENVPPRPEWGFGEDPHGFPRKALDANLHIKSFYEDGTIDSCETTSPSPSDAYCYANGWDGVTGL